MPGLKQLQQFNSDILNLGDEVKIRSARGEKPVTVKIPNDVKDVDDSEDFLEGLPSLSEEEQLQAEAAAEERLREANDFSDFMDNSSDKNSESSQALQKEEVVPDVSDLLPSAGDMSLDDLDLSDFEDTKPSPEPEPEPEEVAIEDMDLESLLAMDNSEEESTTQESEPDFSNISSEPDGTQFDASLFDDFNTQEESKLPEIDEASLAEALSNVGVINNTDEPSSTQEIPTLESITDEAPESEKSAVEKELDSVAEQEQPETSNEQIADIDDLPSFDMDSGSEELPSFDLETPVEDLSLDNIDLTASQEPAETSNEQIEGLDDLPSFDMNDVPSDTEQSEQTESTLPQEPQSSLDSSDSLDVDLDSLDLSVDDIDEPTELSPEMEVPEEEPIETFDTSDIENLDFSGQEDSGADFALGNIDSSEDSDEFHIPGFSDIETANLDKKQDIPATDFSNASSALKDSKPKNTFTDAEYKRFQKNLATYPLNVRIALEDFVVRNEFTDDAIFSVLEKVLRKAPARQVASELEKLLDISLEVPRDFEHRSVAEYEAYKKSVEYQLRNKIIPGAIFSAITAILVYCIFTLTSNFIYKPLRANSLYKQGYALLQDSQYPQSEEKFNQALIYRPEKKWFFRYAEGYREHRQYDRSRMMYNAILQRYNHDKKAGLDWANMEYLDLYNYEEAERILKREVLDYNINDAEAILALGDVYLEWASEKDPDKFPEAKENYDLLIELYGSSNLYLSRQMRYFIRTDNLRQVLAYKDIFIDQKKALSAQDSIELSGYILDKRYGKLRPSEESLRSSIEDVRKLLENALKIAPDDAVALYNMGRYFVATKSGKSAQRLFEASLKSFESQQKRNKKNTYKYINAYRLLGEEMRNQREYLTAEDLYGKGIEVFEKENASSGFESDENIGILYSDLADLDYFISGDNVAALKNYENAVNNKHDNASIRYKIGYIQYQNKNYPAALGSFIRSQDTTENDPHLLLSLANTLSLSNDNYVARGYYERLLSYLDVEKQKYDVVLPQVRDDHADIVDTYMKATNNLGVTLSRIAAITGDSSMNAKAIVNLQESLRAWDAMTRNQTTMIRLEGSNLAEQNIKYITRPIPGYEAEIYTEIPRLLYGEEGLN